MHRGKALLRKAIAVGHLEAIKKLSQQLRSQQEVRKEAEKKFGKKLERSQEAAS